MPAIIEDCAVQRAESEQEQGGCEGVWQVLKDFVNYFTCLCYLCYESP